MVALDVGGGWNIFDATDDKLTFGKWGAFSGGESNISPSPEAFYLGLQPESHLEHNISAIDLNLPRDTDKPASKVVTFQCLCQVKGKMKFKLVNYSDEAIEDEVLDELVVESPADAFTDTMLVTLRAQVNKFVDLIALTACLWIENMLVEEGQVSAMKVYWQQAWGGTDSDEQSGDYPMAGGLANAGHLRATADPVNTNTYPWAVNALGIKAASRFQLPLLDTSSGGDAEGMGWKSEVTPADYEVVEGEAYQDEAQHALMGNAGSSGWFALSQPERVSHDPAGSPYAWAPGDAKNIVYTGATSHSFILSTSLSDVAPGTIVRVFNFCGTGNSVTWTVGMAIYSISNNQMTEFVFYNDGGTGRWLVTQSKVAATRWP